MFCGTAISSLTKLPTTTAGDNNKPLAFEMFPASKTGSDLTGQYDGNARKRKRSDSGFIGESELRRFPLEGAAAGGTIFDDETAPNRSSDNIQHHDVGSSLDIDAITRMKHHLGLSMPKISLAGAVNEIDPVPFASSDPSSSASSTSAVRHQLQNLQNHAFDPRPLSLSRAPTDAPAFHGLSSLDILSGAAAGNQYASGQPSSSSLFLESTPGLSEIANQLSNSVNPFSSNSNTDQFLQSSFGSNSFVFGHGGSLSNPHGGTSFGNLFSTPGSAADKFVRNNPMASLNPGLLQNLATMRELHRLNNISSSQQLGFGGAGNLGGDHTFQSTSNLFGSALSGLGQHMMDPSPLISISASGTNRAQFASSAISEALNLTSHGLTQHKDKKAKVSADGGHSGANTKREVEAAKIIALPDTKTVPEIQEAPLPPYTTRKIVPLATQEDSNWLSDFLLYVRAELVEVFRANNEDVAVRITGKNKIIRGQVGIRCRFCAHLCCNQRGSRSSSFPSSVSRIYQSLTMMIRDHFANCGAMPLAVKKRFLELRADTAQGATKSKLYWVEAAHSMGMQDSDSGIILTDVTLAAASAARNLKQQSVQEQTTIACSLVEPSDRGLVSDYMFELMSQVQRVTLNKEECVGNRRGMQSGLPGFACKYCCNANRRGTCRFFPGRRRTLPSKIREVHDHMNKCPLCPVNVKERLSKLELEHETHRGDAGNQRTFYDRIWSRLYNSKDD